MTWIPGQDDPGLVGEIRIVVRDDCPPGSIYTSPDGKVTCHPCDIRKAALLGAERLARVRKVAGSE